MRSLMVMCWDRSLVYVEGDASIRVFQDEQGKKHSALNVVQRKTSCSSTFYSVADYVLTD